MTKRYTFLFALWASLSGGCTFLSCNDGLNPDQWDARERERAGAGLTEARRELEKEFTSALQAHTPSGPLLAELTTPVRETFYLGGVSTLGGPLHRHGLFGGPSMYLIAREEIWVTPQEVVLMFSQSATTGRAFTNVVRLPYSDLAEVRANTFLKSNPLFVASRRANTSYVLVFAPSDSTRVAQLVALILQRAPTAGSRLRGRS